MTSMPTALDEHPELATNEHWRGVMKRARQARQLSQEQLAAKVGYSQNVISGLETGSVGSSKAIFPICQELKIPLPFAMIVDDMDQRWLESGRVLRARAPQTFETLLSTAEQFVRQLAGNPEEH